MLNSLKTHSSIWLFLFTALIIALIQYFMLKPHLSYAFADIDWGGLLQFKHLKNPFSLESFLNMWNRSGVYATQYYYLGIQEYFFGLDFYQYNIVAYILKFLSTITAFPLFYIITKRKLIATLGTLIYAYSFTTVAALYTVMTTINYLGITFMNIFLWIYWYLAQKKRTDWRLLISVILTFYLAFFLATERMYPLMPLVIIGEFLYICSQKFSKSSIVLGAKRLLLLFTPVILLIFIRPNIQSDMIPFFIGNSMGLFQKIFEGNSHLLFTPFASLGSMFLPKEYPLPLGVINLDNLTGYLKFLLGGPLFIFGNIILISGYLLSKNPRKFILVTLTILITLFLASFYIATRRLGIDPSSRIYFDPSFVMPNALVGMFVLSLACAFFLEWIDRKMKDNLTLCLFMGPAMAFLFIFITWLPADIALVFVGIHRYLTIPAIGVSLLIATAFVLIYEKLYPKNFTRPFALAVFLLPLLMFVIYSKSIANYFDYELNVAGTKASEHIRMKGKLKSYLKNFSLTEPSVFYFDESQDHNNSYFNETIIMAGFNFWMMFQEDRVLKPELTPLLLRTYFLCGGNEKVCPEKLKEAIVEKDGIKGFLFSGVFYKPENFYAFRFKNRDLYDIRDEIMQTLGLKSLL